MSRYSTNEADLRFSTNPKKMPWLTTVEARQRFVPRINDGWVIIPSPQLLLLLLSCWCSPILLLRRLWRRLGMLGRGMCTLIDSGALVEAWRSLLSTRVVSLRRPSTSIGWRLLGAGRNLLIARWSWWLAGLAAIWLPHPSPPLVSHLAPPQHLCV